MIVPEEQSENFIMSSLSVSSHWAIFTGV